MSKYLLMSAMFLLQAGAGCHALRLGSSECITWTMAGRLGNQFSGLANALFEAEMCGRPCVFSNPGQQREFKSLFDLPEIIHLSDHLSNDPGSYWCRQALAHKEFSHGFWANPPPVNFTKNLFNKHLSPLLKRPMVDRVYGDGALIVHLRGGDIMDRHDADYMPAPCAFYLHVIEHGNNGEAFQHVSVISDDEKHPCFGMIAKMTKSVGTNAIFNFFVVGPDVNYPTLFSKQANIQYTGMTVEDDFMLLVSGKSIALSTSSTFGFSGISMNPHEQVDIFMPMYAGEPMCCDGNFQVERLLELCSFGRHSKIFEFPFPHDYGTRASFIASAFAIDTSTIIHDCASKVF